MKTNISIVIPTFKRKKYVIQLLRSFKNKLPKNTEVIIVEQVENNSEEYSEIVRISKIPIKYFFMRNQSTSKAKNIGVKKSKGNFVFFFDDDVILRKKIDVILGDFKDHKVAAVTGRVITKGQKLELNKKDVGRISFLSKFSDGYSSTIRQEVDTVIGCNACWRKDVLRSLKGFDEKFTGNALREESDLSLRAKKRGYKILFDPKIEVFHDRAETGGARKTEGRIQWYFDFFSNETYFFLKHRPKFFIIFMLLSRAEWALRCMFGFGREVSFRSLSAPFLGVIDGFRKYKRI